MPSNDDHSSLQNLGTVMGAPENGLRYMRRRRVGTADRNGDPLDGIVNLFDVAIVLAVGFLVAALAAAGVTGLLTNENMTIVTNPGTPRDAGDRQGGRHRSPSSTCSPAQQVGGRGHAARLVLQARRRHRRLRARRRDGARRRHAGAGRHARSRGDAASPDVPDGAADARRDRVSRRRPPTTSLPTAAADAGRDAHAGHPRLR